MEKQQIRDAYKLHWLENGRKPLSVYAFCKPMGVSETEFYEHYSSLESIDKDIWKGIFEDTRHQLQGDEVYRQYSVREKLLTFYFVWVQKLKENRSYILLQKDMFGLTDFREDKLSTFRRAFYSYIRDLIREGYESGEIKERKFISDQYVHGFWVQALFVLRYWVKDSSEKFELTDAAIEKAVNLSFELVRTNTLDSLFDFGKFILTRKY
ncbi:MAG: TetR/AcrR family transcriptional regulator [Chitinophagaceae bacterium]|nr:TetR/AcrR family transcriptional regulator [Chitinophagaceae bacterium]